MRFAGLAAALTLMAASAALGSSERAAQRRTGSGGASTAMSGRARQAVLDLYALDSRLHAWRTRVASLEAAVNALQQRRIALRQELGAAQSSLKNGQHRLGLEIRTLYERGNVDPVAVMLGATTLTRGLRELDALRREADQSRQIVDTTTAARARLLASQARFAVAERRLTRSLAAAREGEQRLAAAAEARLVYVSSLRSHDRLRATQVRTVQAAAHAAQRKSQRLQEPTAAPAADTHELAVSATCYDLPGTTATGMPVGRGVVAVDPSVIPLGSRLYIPGYGDGVAADIGGGIKGNVVDLWFPTYGECAAWGRRTVTITIY